LPAEGDYSRHSFWIRKDLHWMDIAKSWTGLWRKEVVDGIELSVVEPILECKRPETVK